MQRTITLSPYCVPSRALGRLRALQPIMQKLYAAVARDSDFLHAALGGSAGCAWCAEELAVFRRVESHANAKPLLLLPNSVFLWPDGDDDAAPVLSVGNVQAGEPHQLELVHALQSAEHADVEGGPLATACATLAAAARLVHPSRQCVAVVTKPAERLAVRTRLDVLGVGARLQREHGVDTVLYVSMDDLGRARLDASGDLMLDGHRISVLYSRCGRATLRAIRRAIRLRCNSQTTNPPRPQVRLFAPVGLVPGRGGRGGARAVERVAHHRED